MLSQLFLKFATKCISTLNIDYPGMKIIHLCSYAKVLMERVEEYHEMLREPVEGERCPCKQHKTAKAQVCLFMAIWHEFAFSQG